MLKVSNAERTWHPLKSMHDQLGLGPARTLHLPGPFLKLHIRPPQHDTRPSYTPKPRHANRGKDSLVCGLAAGRCVLVMAHRLGKCQGAVIMADVLQSDTGGDRSVLLFPRGKLS